MSISQGFNGMCSLRCVASKSLERLDKIIGVRVGGQEGHCAPPPKKKMEAKHSGKTGEEFGQNSRENKRNDRKKNRAISLKQK